MSKRNGYVSPDRKIVQVIKHAAVLNQNEGLVERTTSVMYSHSPANETYSDESMVPEAVNEFCRHATCKYEGDGIVNKWIYTQEPIKQSRNNNLAEQFLQHIEDKVMSITSAVIMVETLAYLGAQIQDANTGHWVALPITLAGMVDDLNGRSDYPINSISYAICLPFNIHGVLTFKYGLATLELVDDTTDREETNE